MRKKKDKIGEPFTPLLHATLDCDAWKALTYPARSLYVALKRKRNTGHGTAYLSFREAKGALGMSVNRIARSFRELEHYGFIVKLKHGKLGSDGKGFATLWRLTELGVEPRASANGVAEPPPKNFLKWDGELFDLRKTKPRSPRRAQGVSPVENSPVSRVECGTKRNRIPRGMHRARG